MPFRKKECWTKLIKLTICWHVMPFNHDRKITWSDFKTRYARNQIITMWFCMVSICLCVRSLFINLRHQFTYLHSVNQQKRFIGNLLKPLINLTLGSLFTKRLRMRWHCIFYFCYFVLLKFGKDRERTRARAYDIPKSKRSIADLPKKRKITN